MDIATASPSDTIPLAMVMRGIAVAAASSVAERVILDPPGNRCVIMEGTRWARGGTRCPHSR
jgi:hypothetical protein